MPQMLKDSFAEVRRALLQNGQTKQADTSYSPERMDKAVPKRIAQTAAKSDT